MNTYRLESETTTVKVCTVLGKLRQLRNVSLETAAKAIGLSPVELKTIESGQDTQVDLQTIIRLCDLYDVDIEKLIA